jgi:hypothetical protein
MSNEVNALVKRRKVGSAPLKSVLKFMADCASDDGSGIYASKQYMADCIEISKRTVIRSVEILLERGLISETGRRACRRGYTVEYRINLDKVRELPSAVKDREDTSSNGGASASSGTTSRGDTMSPVTPRHPRGDTLSPEEVTPCHPNQSKTKIEPIAPGAHTQNLDIGAEGGKPPAQTADAFADFFAEFQTVYPRLGCIEATEDALRSAIEAGVDPSRILAGARAYAAEQQGNEPRYIAYSENWVTAKRWERHPAPSATAPADKAAAIQEQRAKAIREGQSWVASLVSPRAAREMLAAGLVTADQCRAVGVDL